MIKFDFKKSKNAEQLIRQLKIIGTGFSGVEIDATKRDSVGVTNREILEFLKADGRNFIDFAPKEIRVIEKIFMNEFHNFMRRVSDRNPRDFGRVTNNALKAAASAALLHMVMIIKKRILTGRDFMGAEVRELTEAYEKFKLVKYGRRPIGIATGQTFDSLDQKNIKVIK